MTEQKIPVRITFENNDTGVGEVVMMGTPITIEAKGFSIECAITQYNGKLDEEYLPDIRYIMHPAKYKVTDLRSGGAISNKSAKTHEGHDTPEGAIAQAIKNALVIDRETYEEKYREFIKKFPLENRTQYELTDDGKYMVIKKQEVTAVEAVIFQLI